MSIQLRDRNLNCLNLLEYIMFVMIIFLPNFNLAFPRPTMLKDMSFMATFISFTVKDSKLNKILLSFVKWCVNPKSNSHLNSDLHNLNLLETDLHELKIWGSGGQYRSLIQQYKYQIGKTQYMYSFVFINIA